MLNRTYTVPTNAWQDQPLDTGGGAAVVLINTDAPLHYTAAANKMTCDPASPSQPGYVSTTAQQFRGSKTIVSPAPQLTLTDGQTQQVTTFGSDGLTGRLSISGATTVDIGAARMQSTDLGLFEHFFTVDALKPPCAYAVSGFGITVTGPSTFNVAPGSLQIVVPANPYVARPVYTLTAMTGLTDEFPAAPRTYIFASITPPFIFQSDKPADLARLADNQAAIAVLQKTEADGGDTIVGVTNIVGNIPTTGSLCQMLLSCQQGPQVTRIDDFYWDGTQPRVKGLHIYAPLVRADTEIVVVSSADWHVVTGKRPLGVDRTYISQGVSPVTAVYTFASNYAGYADEVLLIPETDIGCILFGFDALQGILWWMPSQAIYAENGDNYRRLLEEYFGKCVKYPGLEQSVLLGYAIPDGNAKMSGARYHKWTGRSAFFSL